MADSEKLDDTNHSVRFASTMEGDLVVQSMTGEEEMGRLFSYQLQLLSMNPELHFEKVVGQQVTVTLSLADGERHFNGFITEFTFLGQTAVYTRYHAVVRPWLWFLTRTSDCRIFQNQKVPDIIKAVFKDNGMSEIEDTLGAPYRKWEYCVQYRESDFNFVSRLMEQEGIYYYFKHAMGNHTLVLADNMDKHKPFPQYEKIPFVPSSGEMNIERNDHLDRWAATQSIIPIKYAMRDYNFKKPKVLVKGLQISEFKSEKKHAYALRDPEIFDYPGEYVELDEGKEYVKLRMQELACQHERVETSGPCRGLAPGHKFKLEDFPRKEQNKEYVVVSVSHQINDTGYVSGGVAQDLYTCNAVVLDKKIPFRSARSTPKPIVQGPQTAKVVGPKKEEIHTDEWGRVKVQFHWDRYGEENENSSCWIRVSQAWAGDGWGGVHIPRINQEVIVSFMEGDPDRPIITGRVYNADRMVHKDLPLPTNKTQSYVRSRSTKGGGPDNFNEIRMEDKKGSEKLYFQAEKDEEILVKNNKTENVNNDETVTIGHNRTETVKLNETLTVMNNRTRKVANTESVTVSKFRTHNVGINENINVGVAQEIVVGGLQAIEVGASQNVDVGVSQTINVGKKRSLEVGDDYNIKVSKNRIATIDEKDTINIGKDWVIEAGDSVTIKCGKSRIVMKKNGNIQLKGKDITFKASGKAKLQASKTLTLKGSSIKEN